VKKPFPSKRHHVNGWAEVAAKRDTLMAEMMKIATSLDYHFNVRIGNIILIQHLSPDFRLSSAGNEKFQASLGQCPKRKAEKTGTVALRLF